MVDVPTVSIVIASASVVVGVTYYTLHLRHQTRLRQTDLIIRLYSLASGREFLDAWEKIRDRKIESLKDYEKKYGSWVEIMVIHTVFQEIGMLLQRKLIDAALVEDLVGRRTVFLVYEKLKSYNEFVKRELQGVESSSFDYLYNEMKKRDQQLASKTT